MGFFKRLFSADYRRGLSAEAVGEYQKAARAYALAAEHIKVGEMHLLAAEREGTPAGRLLELRAAARWAEGDGATAKELRRRVARALVEHVRPVNEATLVADADRKLLRDAAALFHSAGDFAAAGECLERAGDEMQAAEAYQEAGDVDRLETVFDREEGRRREGDRKRDAHAEYEMHLRSGSRDRALAQLRESHARAPSASGKRAIEELSSRLLRCGTVPLLVGDARAPTTYIGLFPLGLGRERSCELPLRDTRISRRHAEVCWQGERFLLRDCRSRNGTFLNSLRIDGELPLVGGGELGLGDMVSVAFRVEGARMELQVSRGADRGLSAIASASPILVGAGVGGGASSLRFADGRPLLLAAPGHRLVLNGARTGGEVQLILGDEIEVVEEVGGAVLRIVVPRDETQT